MEVILVDRDHAFYEWQGSRHFINAALKRDPQIIKEEDAIKEILSGNYRLWVVKNDGLIVGAAMTSVDDFPSSRCLQIIAIGGIVAKDWKDILFDEIEKFARDMKCEYVLAMGREGWKRFKPDYDVFANAYCKRIA